MGNKLFATNYNDLLELVKEEKKKISSCEQEIWFRGQADASYVLLPSLFRAKNGLQVEKELFFKYRQLTKKLATTYNATSDEE